MKPDLRKRPRKPHVTRACGKKRFRDQREAQEALHRVAAFPGQDRVPVRAYACDRCHGYHLTSRAS